jgi:AcrR family transcriptional regulator
MTNQDDPIHQEILQAAFRLYRKAGPKDVTMDNVAKAAGRSRSSLYYYFKNRDEIFQAVLEQIAKDVSAEIRQTVAAASGLNDRIYAFCFAKIKLATEWKRVFTAMDQVMNADEKSAQAKLMDALHKKLMYLESGILMNIMSEAIQKDGRKPGNTDLDMLAFMISAGTRGIRREIYEHNDPHDANAAAALLSAMVAKWLEA